MAQEVEANGMVFTFPDNATRADIEEALNSHFGQQDSLADDLLDLGGEIAAGANRAAMFVPDTAVKAVNLIPGVDIPTPSEAIEGATGFRPGQGGYMDPGLAQQAVSAAGEVLVPGAAGLTSVAGRNLATVPGAVAEFLGLGTKAPAQSVASAVDAVVNPPAVVPTTPSAQTQRNLNLARRVPDVDTAGLRMTELGEVVPDPKQAEAIRQGLEEGRAAAVAAASPQDRATMREMLDIRLRGRKNAQYRDKNRPVDAIGDVLTNMLNEIANANQQAGKNIGFVARQLEGKPYDAQPALRVFREGLQDMGVRVVADPKTGKPSLNFTTSALNQIPEAQSYINRAFQNLLDQPMTDGRSAHNMKKFLDELVKWGDSAGGIKGQAENFVKQFRTAIDDQLDATFPQYDTENQIYKATIEALNAYGDAVGARIDPSNPKATGLVGRRLLSNAVSQPQLENAIELIDKTSKSVGGSSGQDVMSLYGFAAEMDRLMGPVAPNTFAAQISTGVQDANRIAQQAQTRGGLVDLAAEALQAGVNKARNVNEEALIKSLQELLAE